MSEASSRIIDGVRLYLSHPDPTSVEWIGQEELLTQLLACWLTIDRRDLPLSPRLVGPPGVGKTTLAMAAARRRGQPVFIFQCTADTRPEDLLVTPVLDEHAHIRYHASPLVTAMLVGGVCILDEGNRMNERSWASLASLLDYRRYVESVTTGVTIPAHPDFRCAVTMNDDISTYEIPEYILSRLQPTLTVPHPSRQDELAILKYHLPFAEPDMLEVTVCFLQRAHRRGLSYSVRDGVQILRYALKRLAQDPRHPLNRDAVWREAVLSCLGPEARDILDDEGTDESQANLTSPTVGDWFFDQSDPLHPDRIVRRRDSPSPTAIPPESDESDSDTDDAEEDDEDYLMDEFEDQYPDDDHEDD
ncbi:MAG: hypothetical protein KatS3mg113_0342 [Planctomycetaceae bacterium]|nr:MAG: hypothetical protein KatS3mg113_0342 [Planctomycetaceae bacterium]